MQALISEWTRAKAGTIDFIESMPDELLGYKPVPDVFSFAEQFIHIGWANYSFAAIAAGRDNPYDRAKGNDPMANEELKTKKAALLEFAGGSYDFVIDALGTLNAASLAETIQFHKWELTRGAVFSKALEHHAHHRGQTAVYFRLNNLKPPSERLF
jgi:uncharacterized damage-inducible protein DinB